MMTLCHEEVQEILLAAAAGISLLVLKITETIYILRTNCVLYAEDLRRCNSKKQTRLAIKRS